MRLTDATLPIAKTPPKWSTYKFYLQTKKVPSFHQTLLHFTFNILHLLFIPSQT
jgi:hypothetical protein